MNNLLNEFSLTRIPIVEIFHSISGEGISAGDVVTFVRVAGCDLRCTWCDTKYSFKENGTGISQLLPEEIAIKLSEIGTLEIICTGGEPLEQNKSKRYLPAYLQSKGFNVRIETSGGSDLYSEIELDFFNLDKTNRPVYTMDIKCPGSGMSEKNNFENIGLLDRRDELKFVVADEEDLDYAMNKIQEFRNELSEKRIMLNFSPVFESMESLTACWEFLKEKTPYFQEKKLLARLSLQIHKFIWPPHQRGV